MATLPADAFRFCGPTYQSASSIFNCERCINLYPELGHPGSKSGVALIGTPGLALFATLPTSPVRALFAGAARLFAVAGTHFYEVNLITGAVVTDYGAMAGSPGVGPCQIVANGRQLLVCDVRAATIYNADPLGPAMTPVFNGIALEYLDGFYVAIASGASLAGVDTNQVNVSAQLDGTTWAGLDFVIRTGAVDQINALAVINGLLYIFGQKNIEIWYNAGNPLFPFARQQGSTINQGCLAPMSVAKMDNAVYWLGSDERGAGAVYRAVGGAITKVSNPGIEELIRQAMGNILARTIFAFTYQEAGHNFYVLNLSSSNLSPGFVVYDSTTDMWHERGSLVGGLFLGWIANCFASVIPSTGRPVNFVGDSTNGNIYTMGLTIPSENGGAMLRQRIAPHVSNENRYLSYPSLALDADIGTAAMVLDYSYNGGLSFLGRNRTIPKAGTLAAAGMDYYKISQLGRARDFVAKITITDANNPIRLINAYLDALKGTEQ